MSKWWRKFRKNAGTQPQGYRDIALYPNPNTAYFYQEKQVWTWPPTPAHEQISALTNCWTGNQLPGYTNFIPGVAQSYSPWQNPTSYQNTLVNQQYNVGYNIQSYGAVQSATLQTQINQAWQNRTYG